jgi:methylmalonyl-CoA mutase C-terminal domain/subunit
MNKTNRGKGIKVIVSMIGLDGHTTGGEVVSMILRDAGFEVIYLGVNQTPEMIIDAAIQEDIDVIGISSHASNYLQIMELVDLAKATGLAESLMVCGGTVPRTQCNELLVKGVSKIFTPGSSSSEIVDYLVNNVRRALCT